MMFIVKRDKNDKKNTSAHTGNPHFTYHHRTPTRPQTSPQGHNTITKATGRQSGRKTADAPTGPQSTPQTGARPQEGPQCWPRDQSHKTSHQARRLATRSQNEPDAYLRPHILRMSSNMHAFPRLRYAVEANTWCPST